MITACKASCMAKNAMLSSVLFNVVVSQSVILASYTSGSVLLELRALISKRPALFVLDGLGSRVPGPARALASCGVSDPSELAAAAAFPISAAGSLPFA